MQLQQPSPGAVDPDDRTMAGDGLKLPRAKELARLVFGEDLDALAGETVSKSFPSALQLVSSFPSPRLLFTPGQIQQQALGM